MNARSPLRGWNQRRAPGSKGECVMRGAPWKLENGAPSIWFQGRGSRNPKARQMSTRREGIRRAHHPPCGKQIVADQREVGLLVPSNWAQAAERPASRSWPLIDWPRRPTAPSAGTDAGSPSSLGRHPHRANSKVSSPVSSVSKATMV
jgi:hypothetical protein